MAEARVRIVLDDEEGGGSTWVTSVPVGRGHSPRSFAVVHAAHEAVALFTQNILDSREQVAEKLIALERVDG